MFSVEISAVFMTPAAIAWLTNAHEARVLHIFDRTCNLTNERGEILSIVTPQIGNGPFNLVIEEELFFSELLSLQSPISYSDNQLNLGNLIIHTADAKPWNPRPDWEELHARRDDIAAQLTKLLITNYQLLITNYQLPTTNYQSSNSLLASITSADIPGCKNAAHKLAGLGIGLTPAGDDFLMGAIYAAWIIHPPDTAEFLAREIADTAAPLTTSLSAAWLRSAGRGEAGSLWHEFFEALNSVGQTASLKYSTAVQAAMNKILSVGETSGADALAGFIGLFRYWGEYCSNL